MGEGLEVKCDGLRDEGRAPQSWAGQWMEWQGQTRHERHSIQWRASAYDNRLTVTQEGGLSGTAQGLCKQQFLNFLPLPHGHGAFRLVLG